MNPTQEEVLELFRLLRTYEGLEVLMIRCLSSRVTLTSEITGRSKKQRILTSVQPVFRPAEVTETPARRYPWRHTFVQHSEVCSSCFSSVRRHSYIREETLVQDPRYETSSVLLVLLNELQPLFLVDVVDGLDQEFFLAF